MAKKPTMITVHPVILEWIDVRVNERLFSSRSHAFERSIMLMMTPEDRREIVKKMCKS